MTLTPEEVSRVARLARIAIGEEERAGLVKHLSDILDFVGELQRCEVAHLAPLAHPLELSARLRADVVSEHDQREALQSGAPEVSDGLYVVPRVIE